MKRFSSWLYKVSTGWVALLGFVVFLIFMVFVLPAQAAGADTFSGETGSPDMSFFYSPQELYKMAEAYGEGGRQAYIQARFTFDLIWPLAYTFFFGTAISWTFAVVFPPDSRWRWANLVPFGALVFDYLENLSTSLVMYRYPATGGVMAFFAPIFTVLKWILVGGSFVLLVFGFAVMIWQFVGNRVDNSG